MRQAQGVGNDGAVRLMPRGYLGKVCGSVGGDNVEAWIDGQVLAIAAADVEADSAGGEAFQKALNYGPWLLVAGLGKVACDLLVDLVDVLVLVLRPAVGVGGGTVSGHVEERDLEGQQDRADAGTWNGRERDACGRT